MDFSGKQEASVGQKGELWVRGPTVVKGYWQNINLTRDKLTPDGWLKTGDVAQCDEKDMFSLIDRVKVGIHGQRPSQLIDFASKLNLAGSDYDRRRRTHSNGG